ncbi:MAG: ABC transporter permease [Clostridia bacterium]|nr:ABC transporter permease [Clostridia bacterium]
MRLKLFKKEIIELCKTPRGWILLLLFIGFSLVNAALARYTPEILAKFGDLGINIPPATFYDSYIQFYKNMNSGVLIAVIIIYMTTVTREVKKGTIYLILTKDITRNNYLMSKYVAANLFFTLSYIIASIIQIAMTALFFSSYYTSEILPGYIVFYLFGLFLLNTVIACSASYKSGGIGAFVGFFILLISPYISLIPVVGKYTPGALANFPVNFLMKSADFNDIIAAVMITAALMFLIIYLSFMKFNKREL